MAASGLKYKNYSIKFYEDRITTTVTSDAASVKVWIDRTYYHHGDRFLLGRLDSTWQWDSNINDFEVAIRQLCVGNHCLIYPQLTQSESIPESLKQLLRDENLTFVGKQVQEDVTRLARKGLYVSYAMDVSHMAAKKYGDSSYKQMGLKTLAMEFLNKEVEKDRKTTRCRSGIDELKYFQVKYACIDAFVSFQRGMKLQMPYYSDEGKMECFAESLRQSNGSMPSNLESPTARRIASCSRRRLHS